MGAAQPCLLPPPRPLLRLTVPRQDEDDLHESVANALNLLLLPPAVWTTFPAGGYLLTKAARARLFRLGMKTGWPDILLVFNARLFGIELKAPGGELTKTRTVYGKRRARVVIGQAETHTMLRAAGATIAVCRSVPMVLTQCVTWGLPLRPYSL